MRDFGGSLEAKAQLMELAFSTSFVGGASVPASMFDEVVLYEDLCTGKDSLAEKSVFEGQSHPSMRRLYNRLGITSSKEQDDLLRFNRSIEQVTKL